MKTVVLTGPDGSGKSTLCANTSRLLEAYLGSRTVACVSVWDATLASNLFASKTAVVDYLNDLDGYTRTLFIYHALSRSIDLAQRKRPKYILIEGFWYKYAVTEIGQGVKQRDVLSASEAFAAPDLTFYLDINPEDAWTRKAKASSRSQVSHYEQGLSTQSGDTAERFLKFQKKLIPIWREIETLSKERNQAWIHTSALDAPEYLAEKIYHQILNLDSQ